MTSGEAKLLQMFLYVGEAAKAKPNIYSHQYHLNVGFHDVPPNLQEQRSR
ncbi:MAG: hypothetical protein NW220_21370 [Leptolyngbyaceae cyanobacterium bins.349]|nr:hypothetical protein [Leptolyngbyaceae cyanobacterium bins.349]